MNEEDIKLQLKRPATKLTAGGFRPSDEVTESWLGKVFLYAPGENVPIDQAGEEMLPLAQFHLPTLSAMNPHIGDTTLITLFMSWELPEPLEPMGPNWLIREYTCVEELERRDHEVTKSHIKTFPLKSETIDEDYPLWDAGGIPWGLTKEIVELENAGQIRDYFDFTEHCYEHKFGGYPSFCQSGIDPGDDFSFIFQVSSDPKINLNIVDGGSLMFWKNVKNNEWVMYYDFA